MTRTGAWLMQPNEQEPHRFGRRNPRRIGLWWKTQFIRALAMQPCGWIPSTHNPVRCCFETLPGSWDTSHAAGKGMSPGPEQPLNLWSGRHIPSLMEGRHVFRAGGEIFPWITTAFIKSTRDEMVCSKNLEIDR
jgi:hypothetical protein